MSGKHEKKIQRGIRREARKVAPGLVLLINRSRWQFRLRLALKVIRAKVDIGDLAEVDAPDAPRQHIIVRAAPRA